MRYYTEVLGLQFSGLMQEFFYFLRCGADHHTINMAAGNYSAIQHFAFELLDVAHLRSACDVLARHKVEILWGPLRHGCGHNIAIYHFDPEGNIIEHCTELDRMSNEALGYSTRAPITRTGHSVRKPGRRKTPSRSGGNSRHPSSSTPA